MAGAGFRASDFQKHRVLPRFSRFFGAFAGRLAREKSSKTTRFIALFAFLAFFGNSTFSCSFFRKSCENHAFYRAFGAARLRFRVRFFVVFARSLFKKVVKTTRFPAFFAFPRPLLFHIRFSSLSFAFFRDIAKTTRFRAFLEFGRQP